MGRYKWERLGLDYRLEGTQPPTLEAVSSAARIFQAAGLSAS
jgi:pyruvate formate lyase activating enzyme